MVEDVCERLVETEQESVYLVSRYAVLAAVRFKPFGCARHLGGIGTKGELIGSYHFEAHHDGWALAPQPPAVHPIVDGGGQCLVTPRCCRTQAATSVMTSGFAMTGHWAMRPS